MKQPQLVLDLSVDGLSLWQPAEAADWTLLGFVDLDDPDLSASLLELRQAAVQAAGPDFATMLLLPDDHIWVQRLHLRGLTAYAKDENARQVLAEATALPKSGFSIAYGDTDETGATAVAATSTEVLDEARNFARDNGFNPQVLASRSFFEGFTSRAIFGDAPKPMSFLPRAAEPVARAPKPQSLPKPQRKPLFALPKIPAHWVYGSAAAALAASALTYWIIDPYEQFLRPPRANDDVALLVWPDASEQTAVFDPIVTTTSQPVPTQPGADLPGAATLVANNHSSSGPTQIGVSFDAAGVYFANVPTPPAVPSGLGASLRWTAPASMFLDSPDAEPINGVAAMQQMAELDGGIEPPATADFLDGVLLTAVSTSAISSLPAESTDVGLTPTPVASEDFAYRDGNGVLNAVSIDREPAVVDLLGIEIEPVPQESMQFASLVSPLLASNSIDLLMPTPQAQILAPGVRPLARPEDFAIIHPTEAIAALTPASDAQAYGPVWLGPLTPAPYPVTEFDPNATAYVRPTARPDGLVAAPLGPMFGPEWQPVVASLPPGVTEFDPKNTDHIRPLPRTPLMVARAAEAAAQASLLALNLPPDAAIDVGLGWEEYNPDNADHIRPQARPASLQELAEAGDLAATAFAIKTSSRPLARPAGIDAIMLARSAEIAAAQAAAAEAEARAQSVAEATAQAMAELQPDSESADLDPDLAVLDDAEPETDVQVASLPTSANVADAATTNGDLKRGEFNLIGIYGTESKRRALIRLPSGRYERVTVGDTFSGWKVAAIGKDAIKIVNGGQDMILEMPD